MSREPSPAATLFAVCFATGLLILNVSAPNVALPAIADDLGADFSQSQLIISAYALTLAALLLTAGTLADLHGRRRIFLVGLWVFAGGSLGCALAPDPVVLIGFRAFQGCGGAIVLSSGLSLLAQEFDGPARVRALGLWGASIAGAFTIGPLEGGLLTDALGWQWLFGVNVILTAPVLVAARRLRESSDPGTQGVDWAGVATLTPALSAGVFALVRGNALGWTSPEILGLVALAAVLGVAFLVIEHRRREPMLDLSLFAVPTFTGSVLAIMAVAVSSFAPVLYLTLYLLEVRDASPPSAGLQLAPFAATAFVVSIVAGRYSARIPLRMGLAAGLGLTAIGPVLLCLADEDSSWTVLVPGLFVMGIGVGIANPFATFATLATVPTSRSGTAAGVNSTFRQLGIAGGIAALGAVLQSTITSDVGARIAGTAADVDGRGGALAEQAGEGDLRAALASLPEGARGTLSAAYDEAFVHALHELLLICGGLALAGAVAVVLLVRTSDLLVNRPA